MIWEVVLWLPENVCKYKVFIICKLAEGISQNLLGLMEVSWVCVCILTFISISGHNYGVLDPSAHAGKWFQMRERRKAWGGGDVRELLRGPGTQLLGGPDGENRTRHYTGP